jgi:hypothetical protein
VVLSLFFQARKMIKKNLLLGLICIILKSYETEGQPPRKNRQGPVPHPEGLEDRPENKAGVGGFALERCGG